MKVDKSRQGEQTSPMRMLLNRQRLGLLVVVASLLLVATHGFLLRSIYRGIVVDRPVLPAEYGVLLYGDPGTMESAARSIQDAQFEKAMIVEFRRSRAVAIGAAPSLASIAKELLMQKGIPSSAIEVLTTDAVSYDGAVRAANARLVGDSLVTIPCPRHASRRLRNIIDGTLSEEEARRLQIQALPESGFDENRWWLSRTGIKRVVSEYLRMFHHQFIGMPGIETPQWDPGAFEQRLRGAA